MKERAGSFPFLNLPLSFPFSWGAKDFGESCFFSFPLDSLRGLGGELDSLELIRYLVDPASSDMLVSKIKPCTCQYKLLYGETANGSLNQL